MVGISFTTYAIMSVIVAGGVIYNAYLHYHQFYPACVYITKSNASMIVSFPFLSFPFPSFPSSFGV